MKSEKAVKKTEEYKMKLMPSGKNMNGETIYHLYVNGKTDSAEYTEHKGLWWGQTHEGEFAAMMLNIPAKYFHDNLLLCRQVFERGSARQRDLTVVTCARSILKSCSGNI